MKNQIIYSITIFVLTAIVALSNCDDQLQKGASKVEISVYYETLCPDCKKYIIETLEPTYKLLQDIMVVRFVPYGKAKITRKAKGRGFNITCQNGPIECFGNKIHACAIYYVQLPILSDYIVCMMKKSGSPIAASKACSKSISIRSERIEKCSYTYEGDKLLYLLGNQTKALTPELISVPTVELNGSQDNQYALINDLKASVCSAYKGVKPSVCT